MTYFCLQVNSSGQYLNIFNGSMANGAEACQGTNNTTPNFLWEIIPGTGDYFLLKVASSGQYLNILNGSTANGAEACQGTNNTTDNFLWQFVLPGSPSPTTVVPGLGIHFYLKVKSSGQYLNILNGSTANGAVACQGTNNSTPNFLWQVATAPLLPLAPVDLRPANGASGVSNNPSLFFSDPGAGTPTAAQEFEFWLFQNNSLLNSPPASGPEISPSPLPSTGTNWSWGTLPAGEVVLEVVGKNGVGIGPSSTSTFTVSGFDPRISVTAKTPLSNNSFEVAGTGFTPGGQLSISVSSSISDNAAEMMTTAANNGSFQTQISAQAVCKKSGGGDLQFIATDLSSHAKSNGGKPIHKNCQ